MTETKTEGFKLYLWAVRM